LKLGRFIWLAILAAPLTSGHAEARDRFQTFFLTAGSSYYTQPPSAGLHGFGELSGANSSARLVADLLSRGGALAGITLVSDRSHFLSKADFEAALEAVAQQIKARGPNNPLLVVYFAGHGVSEGVAWNHFSVPGNVVYGAPLARLDVDEIARHMIHAGLLTDKLDALKIPYLLLLDTCYAGQPVSFTSPVLTDQAIQNLQAVAGVLRFMNEFHIPNPVIFSAEPGTEVPLAPDPRSPTQASLGPIARRILLVSRKVAASGVELSLSQFVAQLTSTSLDNETKPPVTHAIAPIKDDVLLGPAAASQTKVEERVATATSADFCCNPDMVGIVSTATGGARMMTGTLVFEGPTGEFVSGGRRVSISGPRKSVSMIERDTHSVELTFEGADGWELDLAAPDNQPLATKRYPAAQRYPFQDSAHPGLSLTGAGRACNSVSGEFTITSLVRDQVKHITLFAADFSQCCDDGKQILKGSVRVSSP
jgi:hypothetical protein